MPAAKKGLFGLGLSFRLLFLSAMEMSDQGSERMEIVGNILGPGKIQDNYRNRTSTYRYAAISSLKMDINNNNSIHSKLTIL